MTKKIETRLTDLEAAAKPGRGFVVLYCDLEGDGYWDQPPYSKDKRRISEDDRRELENQYDTVIVVEYVKDWRSVS